jgi:integrase
VVVAREGVETDKRRQPPPAPLDHYERHEIEALVRVCEQGAHRAPRHYKGRPVVESAEEQAAQRAEDQQDAAAFALMFYSGLRLGELLALAGGTSASCPTSRA